MAKKIEFSKEDEEFFGTMGSFGIPKFDNAMRGGVPRGFTIVAFTETGSGSDLFAKQFVSPAEEPDNSLYIATDEGQQDIVRIFQKYNWPLDIKVRTIGEEYNSNVSSVNLFVFFFFRGLAKRVVTIDTPQATLFSIMFVCKAQQMLLRHLIREFEAQ